MVRGDCTITATGGLVGAGAGAGAGSVADAGVGPEAAVRRWAFCIRLGGNWIGSRPGGGALTAMMGFGAMRISSKGRALRAGGG